ncbi:PhzF family phenazine biosynthesis protein [Bacillus suaedaesalsae]|uniref:PhzF family phenazine biosynthesis protein n=1 Tax=Bacillus suaedaesalsae TaxID=2810349 RepID=A0ABS2DHX9_9BACI|nr:PhzF family phenazine biosynthesis protein [Bacillus suaedaesalsae]MBM6618094.1 PhzF family phenazine biosynthesis protein [Bacillus suaedaesalsae]
MKTLNYYLLDVFTNEPFGGNQLAVFMDGQGLSTAQMQTIAKELNLSETVFLLPPELSTSSYKLRIFTPKTELPFAGHPTIGTAYLLATLGLVKTTAGYNEIKLEENVGQITVHIYAENEKVIKVDMLQPIPQKVNKDINNKTMAALLSINEDDIHTNLPIEIISAGIPFVYVPVKSLQAMKNIEFRLDVWNNEFANSEETQHIFVFSLETDNPLVNVHSRMFAPAMGITEDPATGSASGPLGFYLVTHNLIEEKGGQYHFISEQGIEMGRPSQIEVTIKKEVDNLTEVKVGGSAIIMAEGKMFLHI